MAENKECENLEELEVNDAEDGALQLVESERQNTVEEDVELDAEHDKETVKAMLKNPKPIIEALLFSSSQPLPAKKIKALLRGAGIQNLPKLIKEINEECEEKDVIWRIEELAGGYVMMTLPDYAPWVKKLQTKKNDDRLTQAALESLAVVAYRQPITRAEVDAVRGVSSGSLLKTLIEKGLLRIAGQAEVPGRPLLYGTTQKFLDVFGLGSLKELPKDQDSLVS
jgi:segregation and condensation protein B